MSYTVRVTDAALRDLLRLQPFQLQRGAGVALRAERAIHKSLLSLQDYPFANRKITADNPFLRELVIAFGASGYVALFEIVSDQTVMVLAIRHQLEEDYH